MMSEDANDRQKRIALLRAQRKQQQQGSSQSTIVSQPIVELGPKEQTLNENDGKSDDQLNIDQPPQIMEISGNETVEILANDIQRRIFQKSQEVAQYASEIIDIDDLEPKKDGKHNQDLKDAMAREFQMAETRTNTAINKILQDRYNQEN